MLAKRLLNSTTETTCGILKEISLYQERHSEYCNVHPVYPDNCMTPNITTQSTKVIMRVLLKAVGAGTLEEFIGRKLASL